ncbi:MAG TPA: tRNA epoxyqueuosine(34) reductase QueG, partial [Ilumatobacteraceae bacterium]
MQRRQPEPIDDAYVTSLYRLATESGLDHVGIAPAAVMERARAALVERKAQGLNDTMEFTYRNPTRSTDPARAVRGAQAMVVAARSYALDTAPVPDTDAGPMGAVARYAWADHYAPLRAGLQAIVSRLRADGYKAVAFADDNSVVDREAAWLAGLGWFGKNANVLVPGAGSFFVLGSVITTAPLPPAAAPQADGCGTCRRCIDGCPTQAIVAPGVVDAGRCLAWLLQRPGIFPHPFRAALGNRIYGCDECQLVCPPTVRFERRPRGTPLTISMPISMATATGTATGTAVETVGDPERACNSPALQAWAPLLHLLGADDQDLLATYGRWYLADRNPVWLRRNALVALGNVGDAGDARVPAVLSHYLGSAEPV